MPNLDLFSGDGEVKTGPGFSVRLTPLKNGLSGTFTVGKTTSASRSGSSMKKGKGKQGGKAEYSIEWVNQGPSGVTLSVPLKGHVSDEKLDVQVQLPMRPLDHSPIRLNLTLIGELTTVHTVDFIH